MTSTSSRKIIYQASPQHNIFFHLREPSPTHQTLRGSLLESIGYSKNETEPSTLTRTATNSFEIKQLRRSRKPKGRTTRPRFVTSDKLTPANGTTKLKTSVGLVRDHHQSPVSLTSLVRRHVRKLITTLRPSASHSQNLTTPNYLPIYLPQLPHPWFTHTRL